MTEKEQNLMDAAREIVSDFNRYGEVLQVGDNGEYGMDSAIGRLNSAVVAYDKEMQRSCENCSKCGETICGNDTERLRCWEEG